MNLNTQNMTDWLTPIKENLGETLPNVLTTLVILIVGWLIAVFVRAAFRKLLGTFNINQQLTKSTSRNLDLERGIASGAYWVVIFFTLVAVFNHLNLPGVSEPINALITQVFEFLPKLISAGLLGLVAWIIATIVRSLTSGALGATTLDEKLGVESGGLGGNLGNVLFWLVILLFLPGILGTLQLEGLLEPVQGMVDEMLAMIPNIFAAGIIGFVGWLLAKILRDITSNLLGATRIDQFAARAGFSGQIRLSRTLGIIVFVLVFIPTLIAALNALQIEAISGPAIEMLDKMMAAIPNIISATLILVITWFVARFVALSLSLMLSGLGLDELPERLSIDGLNDRYLPSILVGKVILFFAMLFATVEAANQLGFTQLSEIVSMLIKFGGQILLGSLILGVGYWLSSLAYKALTELGTSHVVANIARFGILGLVAAMGLRAMGLADDIVNLAFGLTLGSIAVAVALAFGLGGREAAGKLADHWVSKIRE